MSPGRRTAKSVGHGLLSEVREGFGQGREHMVRLGGAKLLGGVAAAGNPYRSRMGRVRGLDVPGVSPTT